MIVLLNGAFGIGKTTVARELIRRLPGSLLFDPEIIGIPLQRAANIGALRVDDFQNLRAWRRLTVHGLRIARWKSQTVIVPMAISNVSYLAELRDGVRSFDPAVRHYCLVAPVTTVHTRLKQRGADPVRHRWQFRRAAECCDAHSSSEFAEHIEAASRDAEEIAAAMALDLRNV